LSEIIDSDLNCHLIPAGKDELGEIMRELFEIRQRHGNKTIDPALVLKHIDILYELGDIFECGTSNPDNFFILADIESLYLGYWSRLSEVDFRNLLTIMANFKGEASLILKNGEYLLKGVKLKNFHLYESSIMTLAGRVSCKRMVLRPSGSSDAEKFSALDHEGFVYPADEALEITKLPFNMTLPSCTQQLKLLYRPALMRKLIRFSAN
jgi:hypothetical protein